jgi:hypothetical protein
MPVSDETKRRGEAAEQRSSEVISVRIPTEEARRLQDVAKTSDDTVSGLIRKAVTAMLEGPTTTPWGPTVDRISSGAKSMTVRHNYGSSTTEAQVPDTPPLTASGSTNTTS